MNFSLSLKSVLLNLTCNFRALFTFIYIYIYIYIEHKGTIRFWLNEFTKAGQKIKSWVHT